ncbi:hypothetical protein EV127DRAFT_442134 [Xylaria flabelliformis]|nr:hypothetical protein EV127DRAFT_442134 [Xylaria flabelliformis]
MCWSLIGLGGSCFVTSTDKTALKGYQVREDGKRRAMCGHESEEVLAREALVHKCLAYFTLLRPGRSTSDHQLSSSRILAFGGMLSFIENNIPLPLWKGLRLQVAVDAPVGLSYVHKTGM